MQLHFVFCFVQIGFQYFVARNGGLVSDNRDVVRFLFCFVQFVGNTPVIAKPEYLIEEVADMIIAQSLGLQQFVQICLHQTLHNVDVSQTLHVNRSEDVSDIDDVLVLEPVEDLDFSQSSLAVSLVLEGADLLDGDLALGLHVHGGHDHAVGSLPDVLEVEIPVDRQVR